MIFLLSRPVNKSFLFDFVNQVIQLTTTLDICFTWLEKLVKQHIPHVSSEKLFWYRYSVLLLMLMVDWDLFIDKCVRLELSYIIHFFVTGNNFP